MRAEQDLEASTRKLKENTCCTIVGNGRSCLRSIEKKDSDYIIMNTGGFLNIKPTIILFEQIPLISSQGFNRFYPEHYLERNFDFEVVYRIIHHELARAMERFDPNRVFINHENQHLGKLNPMKNEEKTLQLKRYAMRARPKLSSYEDDLGEYFEKYSNTHLLDFRGSVIRAFSLALSMGYEEIRFTGIDLSSNIYWWECHDAIHHLDDSAKQLISHFKIYTKLKPVFQSSHSGENNYLPPAPITECLFYTIKIAKKIHKDLKKKFPIIKIDNQDPRTNKAYHMYL